MKFVYQYAKLARRIQNLRRRCMQILNKNRRGGEPLTPAQFTSYRDRVAAAAVVERAMKSDLRLRNVGGMAFRDARPLKQQRAWRQSTERVQISERAINSALALTADLALAHSL
jgi:hypothetical protein